MNTKRVGQIIREAREDKKLSVKDVAKETNIAAKYIIALETEDYSQFPAETFALGFLKNYASYLKLDTAMLLNLYRGEQIEESQAPLEELTRPTTTAFSLDRNKIISLVSIFLFVISAYIIYISFEDSGSGSIDEETTEVGSTVETVASSDIPSGINFVSQSVPENASVPFILTEDRGVSFSVNNQQCKMFIKGVSNGKANLGFNIFPEKNVYFFQTAEGEETILSYRIEELTSLRRDIRVVTQAVTEKSAKVLVTLKEEREGAAVKSPVGDVPIQVTLFFSKPSYVEFVLDGQMGERGPVSAGEVKHLEARDRLEIKVGDGGAVEMVQNGKERSVLGKPGKLVKKIFIRKPNPYDSTQSIIGELGE
ncbi:helix-turn-helix domain-containing protein [Leptospira vanthielii]|uniref:DNA-binding helix-turn-helix protein n=1 Tax=Leptospira vanthielii serovar Holland str. Waz Holland = ATCC 700522 TaxID=1218591 RepID=N1W177_9LEPT|nr:helix-turn-helix domain-containing protein [Leptospira vanthielii]EMY69969.1 DNA-binding helix-turn-helix protein [Leptospira vanthielii serovar Holland str. Waz Holland = ATCC 700522]